MRAGAWRKHLAILVLISALPIGCHGDFEAVAAGVPTAVVLAAASGDADSIECTCQQDCFCCAHVLPVASFELPAAPASGLAPMDLASDTPVDRTNALYHPPRA